MPKTPLTIAEAAQILGVSDKTIRRMIQSRQLKEHGRDAGNRILITQESIDAAAVAMGRKVTAREEVREIAPALNANAEASLAAVNAFAEMIRERDQRIFELQQELARLEAERKFLPLQQVRVEQLEHQLAEAEAKIAELQASQITDQTTGQESTQALDQEYKGFWRRLLGL
jgi:excisionase family DNA binding protein